jgi:hypothetical protein
VTFRQNQYGLFTITKLVATGLGYPASGEGVREAASKLVAEVRASDPVPIAYGFSPVKVAGGVEERRRIKGLVSFT